MEPFFVFLPCNVRSTKDTENTISNYVTKLRKRLQFPVEEQWEVAMTQFSFTKSWLTLNESSPLYLMDRNDLVCKGTFFPHHNIPKGNYESPTELVEKIRRELDAVIEIFRGKHKNYFGGFPSIKFDSSTHSISLSAPHVDLKDSCFFVNFSPELNYILGGNEKMTFNDLKFNKYEDYGLFQGGYSYRGNVDLNNSYHSLYVYTDIVQPSLVGDSFSQILNIVQVEDAKFGSQCVVEPQTLVYHPLQYHDIEKIEIDIKNDHGENVPFTHGRTIVTLHFRPRNKK